MANFNEVFANRSKVLSVKLIEALKSRKFEAYFCLTKKDALNKALSLIPAKSSVAWCGSETVEEIVLIDALSKDGDRVLLDRYAAETDEEWMNIMRKAYGADCFLMSTNAITEDGELVNIDGLGNRTSAMIFGPSSVIVIVGMNKVCSDLKSALNRARQYAAPMNAMRLEVKTPCTAAGKCFDCKSEQCICAQIVITRLSKIPGRIKVILVGESLGY
jgi:hypothetical protein